jgi:serine protease Do
LHDLDLAETGAAREIKLQDLLGTIRHALAVVAVAAGLSGWFILRESAPAEHLAKEKDQIVQKVADLSRQVSELRQEREMPALILNRHSSSICFIYADYVLKPPSTGARPVRVHLSGTGFVVAAGWIATNRHVAEPWYLDAKSDGLRARGFRPRLEKLLAFFPEARASVELSAVMVSQEFDLAVAAFDPAKAAAVGANPQALPLATRLPNAGDAVLVVGYPMGVEGMLAKSPLPVYRRLSLDDNHLRVTRRLAEQALIRPSATQGHLGDVVGDKLLYDASTAQGGSGGPVLNVHGDVVGVNSAYLNGFSGGTLGISVQMLKPLLEKAQTSQPQADGLVGVLTPALRHDVLDQRRNPGIHRQ